ncbi:MAG: hypothetical protein RML95_07015 [Anaerolineae bacterium]|nr:hypothetical protein [Anaerolineae bacterium]MDW8299072.1 hypothetical protein [Anaerolineae bacterium]
MNKGLERMWRKLALICTVLLLAACGNAPAAEQTSPSQPQGEVIGWDRNPNTIVMRLDRIILNESPRERLNRLPACTLYGDGRLVWVSAVPPAGEEVSETYLDEVTMRSFLEYIIRDLNFYDLPDLAAQEFPPSENAAQESLTLNVSRGLRTIRSYRGWANNAYLAVLERCRTINPQRALFVPTGAWITVYQEERNPALPEVGWPLTAPFRLAEVAASGEARWISGVALAQLWSYERQTLGRMQWIENNLAYRVAIQVPNISRDSPPAPSISETPTPNP